jgi:4-hydroxythreonine-4-phosphate dehydrogenase
MTKPRIGISIGDVNGIGPEVIIKTLAEERLLQHFTPVIYGASKVLSYHKNFALQGPFSFQTVADAGQAREGKVNVVNCWEEDVQIQLGEMNADGGKFAFLSLDRAVTELREGLIQALVTAPIHKKAMAAAEFPDVGHTEYLSRRFDGTEPLMLMVADTLRVGLVTTHVPLADVSALISKERVMARIRAMQQTLRVDFGLERPVIAVLGLNPHAGDEGLIGTEDDEIIRPAIIECKKAGIMATGPHPADGFFGSGAWHKADGVLAMYHDQGLAPFKALSFGKGVNFTAGLPAVRTSPDHGVGYDIAGKGQADPGSFRAALFLALDVWRARRDHAEWHANPLQARDTFRKGEDEKVSE